MSDGAAKDGVTVRPQFVTLVVWSHVLKVVEALEFLDLPGVERFEHHTARDLRSNNVGQPGGTASPRTGNDHTLANVSIHISIKRAAYGADAPLV